MAAALELVTRSDQVFTLPLGSDPVAELEQFLGREGRHVLHREWIDAGGVYISYAWIRRVRLIEPEAAA